MSRSLQSIRIKQDEDSETIPFISSLSFPKQYSLANPMRDPGEDSLALWSRCVLEDSLKSLSSQGWANR